MLKWFVVVIVTGCASAAPSNHQRSHNALLEKTRSMKCLASSRSRTAAEEVWCEQWFQRAQTKGGKQKE